MRVTSTVGWGCPIAESCCAPEPESRVGNFPIGWAEWNGKGTERVKKVKAAAQEAGKTIK